MSEAQATWGNDDLTKYIDEQIRKMSDRPKVVLVILNLDQSKDAEIIRALKPFGADYMGSNAYNYLGISFGVFRVAFEYGSLPVGDVLATIASLPFSEAALYVEGQARLHVQPLASPALDQPLD